MDLRPYPKTADPIEDLSRHDLIDRILHFNEVSTFHFSEGWLRKQRTTRLRELLRDSQERSSEIEFGQDN